MQADGRTLSKMAWTTWRSSAVPALLLVAALVTGAAVAEDDDDHHKGGESTICDKAECGRGSCSERLGWIPWTVSYKCECDPGWTRATTMVASSPCNIPESCVAVNCGHGGECKKEEGFHYHCECEPGYANMLNNTKFPCIDHNCLMGMHCPALHDPAPPPAPTASPGSVSTQCSLLQLLFVASLMVM
ncbi:hypothetical protein U9M48_009246 [Paspalum notatum var. saurae]|uniref:EGF-like domain-containing protein n=1 Tax=Paspalum notatum var. saurae TaxID=547442 RepID=A0AAQ3SQI9_PASNO